MKSNLIGNQFNPSKIGNYDICTNICNAVAFGKVGYDDDFFLAAAEIDDETYYPLITCNIFDENGKNIFKLVRNRFVSNPGNCKKINKNSGFKIEYKNETVLDVRVENESNRICKIAGRFYNSSGEIALDISDKTLEINTPSCLGFSGNGFGIVSGMDENAKNNAKIVLGSSGKINRVLTGEFTQTKISFDGSIIFDAQINNCEVTVEYGEFILYGKRNQISNSHFAFGGIARNIRNLVLSLENIKGRVS